MLREEKKLEIILLVLILISAFAFIYTVYSLAGPQWDLVTRSLLGKTVINYFTHHISAQVAFVGEFQNNLLYYYEPYREPASTLAFAFLSLFFQNTILPYLVLTFILYALATYALSKEFKIDKLVAFSAFFNSYMLYYLFLPNGGEVLAVIFVMLGLIFLLRKRALSGLFFAIATLSKYPAIALLPLVLFAGDRKTVLKAIALEALVILLFMGFDYLIYANPIYSFTESIANSTTLSTAPLLDLGSLYQVLIYPIWFFAIGVLALKIKGQKLKFKLDRQAKILISMVLLAAIECAVIIPHNDPETQARYGFLLATGLLIPASLVLNSAVKKMKNLNYAIAVLAIVILASTIYATYTMDLSQITAYYNPNAPNNIYVHAETELSYLGFGGCNFISNNWIDMLYKGYDAYSPFSVYPSPVISPIAMTVASEEGVNYTAHVQHELEYPIIVFKYNGVANSFIVNINQSKLVYSDANISIYLPANATCYKDTT